MNAAFIGVVSVAAYERKMLLLSAKESLPGKESSLLTYAQKSVMIPGWDITKCKDKTEIFDPEIFPAGA